MVNRRSFLAALGLAPVAAAVVPAVAEQVPAVKKIPAVVPDSWLFVSSGQPPSANAGMPYSHFFPISGGETPYRFEVIDGTLPDGLALDEESGVVSGVPSGGPNQPFCILATDHKGRKAQVGCFIDLA